MTDNLEATKNLLQKYGWLVNDTATPLTLFNPFTGLSVRGDASSLLITQLARINEHPTVAFATVKGLQEFVTKVVSRAANTPESEAWRWWPITYDSVFQSDVSGLVCELLDQLGEYLEYYDPDSNYEKNLRAYESVLREKVAQLEYRYGNTSAM